MRRLLAIVVCSLAAAVVTARPAGAHAEIRESDPPAGGVTSTGTDEISMTFISLDPSEPVEVSVLDPDGDEQVDGEIEVEETALGTLVRAPVRPLGEGTHLVSWRAMSDDGDGITADVFEFSVESTPRGSGAGIWLLWIVALAVPAAIFLLPRRRRAATHPPPDTT